MSKNNKKQLVKPSIKVEGDVHPFEDFEAQGELPVIKSIGYMRVSENSRDYVSYIITSRGSEILSIEVGEPNNRLIAVDETKINFMTIFENADDAMAAEGKN